MAENARSEATLFAVQLSNSRANCDMIGESNRCSLLVTDYNNKEVRPYHYSPEHFRIHCIIPAWICNIKNTLLFKVVSPFNVSCTFIPRNDPFLCLSHKRGIDRSCAVYREK